MGQFNLETDDLTKLNFQLSELDKMVRGIGNVINSYTCENHANQASVVESSMTHARPDSILAKVALKIYASRRDREKLLPAIGLFNDPAWDILLDLFISHSKDKYISVTDASLAGQVPATTALRWVWALEAAKLIERQPDRTDKRRSFVLLTETGLTYMRRVLAAIDDRMAPSPLMA